MYSYFQVDELWMFLPRVWKELAAYNFEKRWSMQFSLFWPNEHANCIFHVVNTYAECSNLN